ncbi:MAG: Fis family transcriptional regulator [Desulfatirhabdiaceae bacterium]
MTNKHMGSTFDSFLEAEGILDECTEWAIKEVIAFQIKGMMEENCLSKTSMAHKMGASRASLERLLDPTNEAVTLKTIRDASVLGRKQSFNRHSYNFREKRAYST